MSEEEDEKEEEEAREVPKGPKRPRRGRIGRSGVHRAGWVLEEARPDQFTRAGWVGAGAGQVSTIRPVQGQFSFISEAGLFLTFSEQRLAT